MQLLNAINLKTKMLLGSCFSILVIALLSGAYSFATSRLNGTISNMAQSSVLLYEYGNADMMHDAIKGDVQQILIQRLKKLPTKGVEDQFEEHVTSLRKSLDVIKSEASDPAVVADLNGVYPDVMAYIAQGQYFIQHAETGLDSPKLDSFFAAFSKLEESMGKLGETIGKLIAASGTSSKATLRVVNRGFMVILILGIFGILALVISTLSVSRRLRELVSSVQGIADDETDLTRRVDVGASRDEVGITAAALNKYLDAMTGIVENLRQASTRLHAAVGNMNYLASETRQKVVTAGQSIDRAAGVVVQVAQSASSVAESAQQTAVSLSDQIMQAAAQANDVAENLESTIMRFKTTTAAQADTAIELF